MSSPHQTALEQLVGELGALTVALEEARKTPGVEGHPTVSRAESALSNAAEAVTRVLLAEPPVGTAVDVAKAALNDARHEVAAVQAVATGH